MAFRPPFENAFGSAGENESPDRFFRESRRRSAPGPSFRRKTNTKRGGRLSAPQRGLGGKKIFIKPLAYFGNLV